VPDEVSTEDLARILGISRQRIDQLVREDVLEREHSRFAFPDAVIAYCAHLRAAAAGRDEEAGPNLAAERARGAKERADHLALKNAQLRGELIEADEAEKRWAGEMASARSRLLAVPNDVAAALPHLTKHDLGVIDRLQREALAEASEPAGEDDPEGEGEA
jgi:terminase small subunit / prophage DNA-packing protein